MKKRIYRSLIGLLLPALLLLSVLVSAIYFNMSRRQEMAAVRDRAVLIAALLERGLGYGGASPPPLADYLGGDGNSARLSVISPDGTVLLDSRTDAGTLENHADRIEFRQALQTGTGEALRDSSTLGAPSYYYALRLADGNVLRLSKTVRSMSLVFLALLPGVAALTLATLLGAHLIARRLTAWVVRPLADLNLDSDDAQSLAVYDELLPFVHKIDGQRREIARRAEALALRADTIETITRGMKEGLLLLDKAGVVLMANDAAARIFTGHTLAGGNILHICREEPFRSLIRDCLEGKGGEGRLLRAGRDYDVHAGPVKAGDGGGAVFFFDMTERRAAETQRREFSANVSHELKTPLTTISALSEMLENGMADDVAGYGARIAAQAGRLLHMIEDIMRLSELDEGKAFAEATPFDLAALADSVSDSLRGKAAEKEVTLRLTADRPLIITSSMRLLDELLYNLIDNAIKYNRSGGAVDITLHQQEGRCVISVADTGIGISPADIPHVFERFYRADKSRSKKTGGTGLGLSIVKHVAEHLGGKVGLESEEGAGTRVWVEL